MLVTVVPACVSALYLGPYRSGTDSSRNVAFMSLQMSGKRFTMEPQGSRAFLRIAATRGKQGRLPWRQPGLLWIRPPFKKGGFPQGLKVLLRVLGWECWVGNVFRWAPSSQSSSTCPWAENLRLISCTLREFANLPEPCPIARPTLLKVSEEPARTGVLRGT